MKHTVNKWSKALCRPLVAGLGAALVVSSAMVACASGESGQPGAAMTGAEVADLYKGIPEHGVELGDPNAPVTIVEISDLQCPFCRAFTIDTLPTLIERYVRPGRVRIVFSPVGALGPDSERAARTALAAGLQDRLFPFVDLFFRNQGRERSGYVTDAFLRKLATDVGGLDVDRMMADRDAQVVTDQLAEARRRANDVHLSAVPSFLIGKTGGEMHVLNLPSTGPDAFTAPVEELLAKQ
jgi:protein-disulfide isomerase